MINEKKKEKGPEEEGEENWKGKNKKRNVRKITVATEGRPLEVEIERNGGKQQIREAYREVWEEEKSEGGMEGDGRKGRKGRKKEN